MDKKTIDVRNKVQGMPLIKSRMTSTWKERCYPILDGGWEPVIV